MEPDEIVSSPPSEGRAAMFYGATCGNCGFRYAEHEGHIARLEEEMREAHWFLTGKGEMGACMSGAANNPQTELGKAAKASNDRLAQAEAVNAVHVTRIQHLSAEVARYMAGHDIGEQRIREAEAREEAMRKALEQLQRSIRERKFGRDADTARRAYQLEVIEAALSPDAGRAHE